jgi:hypothetical protein
MIKIIRSLKSNLLNLLKFPPIYHPKMDHNKISRDIIDICIGKENGPNGTTFV